jgi:outer membrane protein assembly factor BamB
MHLAVTCPRCESKYQLAADMRGKRMRCPNPICRAVFEVRDDNDPPTEVAPPVETKPVEVKQPEPVKRKPIPKPIEPQPAFDFPDDFPGDDEAAPAPTPSAIVTEAWQPETWEAPAVREAESLAPMRETEPLAVPAPRKRRRALWVIGAMLLLLGVIAGAGYWRISRGIESNEAERFQKAAELYKQQEFAEASSALQKLHRDFPDSPHNKKYRFLAELSDVRGAAYGPRETPDEAVQALERVLQVAGMYRDDPLLKERATDVGETLHHLSLQLTRLAEQEKTPALLPLGNRAWTEAKKYGVNSAERDRKLQDEWTRIEQLLAAHVERQHVLAALHKHLDHITAADVQEAWALVEKAKRQDDAEIRTLLADLFKAHRDQIKFVPTSQAEKSPILDEDALPSMSVTPSVKAERAVGGSQPLVLALARGVLYALEPAKGELRWARRVGIDTHLLPLRVPADAITPELVLAVSSDQRSLSALIAETGEALWQTPLSDACLGQPVLVDRQVLVPTLAGRIEEIEIAEGRVIGSYSVGQPMTLGGVQQPGTPFVYFPADEFCLYVIDITKRTCTNILYTRHRAGSLRGLPAIVSGAKGAFLLWCEAKGLDHAEIKPYALPIQHAEQKPVEPMVELPGISFAPWCDADRLAVATDEGFLSLWGFQQKGTRDPLLFPLLKKNEKKEDEIFFLIDASGPGRSQVVYADAENYWTLTRGRLQRVQAKFDPAKGPGLKVPWTEPIPLGMLLHAVQTGREPDGRTILYLTTQADEHPTCLCSAVDADAGKILWQRQLGILPQQAPLVAGSQILLRDAHGVMRFDVSKSEKRWQPAGDWLVQEPWTDATRLLLQGESSCVQLTLPRDGKQLHVQKIGPFVGAGKAEAFVVAFKAPLRGTPVLGDGFLLLPLASRDFPKGIIARVNLQDKVLIDGPDWRAAGAEADARGHLLLLNATEFVISDGSRGLARIAVSDGKSWNTRAKKKLAHRITQPPVLVPATESAKPRLCVADASDTLTLLDADPLTEIRHWSMPGKITAGPFVRAGKIGCVVGRNRLVWLDPNEDKFVWEYTFAADIVGEPNLLDGKLVVADVAGHFVALEPSNGRPLGGGLTMKANVAPTAAPLPFGPGRAFVPLTDGTIVLLPLEKLRAPN